MHTKQTVHILLATYNGARYLDDQLQSIARQTHNNWTLTVSDDGSTDDTVAIVQRFSAQVHQQVTLLQGPRQGSSTANFVHLIMNAPTKNSYDLYAFCDQDDVWNEDKLQRAVNFHTQHSSQSVRLYCGRTQFVDERLQLIGLSPGIKRPPSFGNALVQNIASGNTMVFSHAVLMAQKTVRPENSVWHDWTTYIVATGLGGIVCFDDQPSLLYRQHANNVLGSNDGLKEKILLLIPLFRGRFKLWNDMNYAATENLQNFLSIDSMHTLLTFEKMRSLPTGIARVLVFINSKIRRQRHISNVMLALALTLKLF